MDCSLPGSSVHGDSPGKNPGVGCHALLQGIFPTQGSNPGIKSRSPTLQVDSLPSEPPEKPLDLLKSFQLTTSKIIFLKLAFYIIPLLKTLHFRRLFSMMPVSGIRTSIRKKHKIDVGLPW